MKKISLVFAGTPSFANEILNKLIADERFDVIAVLTQPDRPSGRKKKLTASEVKNTALNYAFPIYTPVTLKSKEDRHFIHKYQPDFLVVCAYGLILPQEVLNWPTYACVNVHASILPRWRGASPVESALLEGDRETGVSIMHMDEGLDTGPVYSHFSVPIEPRETGDSLLEKLTHLGGDALCDALPMIINTQLKAVMQEKLGGEPSYAHKITDKDARINWELPAEVIDRQIRALYSRRVCYTFMHQKRVKVHLATVSSESYDVEAGTIVEINKNHIKVACKRGLGSVCLLKIQVPLGKGKVLDTQAFLNGYPELFSIGEKFVSI